MTIPRIGEKIPRKFWLILELDKLSIEDFSYIKVCSPCVYRDDIPPLENWYPINFDLITDAEIQIIRCDFPLLFKRIVIDYNSLKKKKRKK
jgi:hypothetical protein